MPPNWRRARRLRTWCAAGWQLADKLDRQFARSGGAAAVAEKQQGIRSYGAAGAQPPGRACSICRASRAAARCVWPHRFWAGLPVGPPAGGAGGELRRGDQHRLDQRPGVGHAQAGLRAEAAICAEVDPAYATLLTDLADRGLLDNTLVVWMGEFGRTPKFKRDGGREHYAEGWLVGLSGARRARRAGDRRHRCRRAFTSPIARWACRICSRPLPRDGNGSGGRIFHDRPAAGENGRRRHDHSRTV